MKITKTLISLFLCIMLLAAPALAIDLEAGTGDAFYVQDTANVLSSETEAMIVQYNETLETQCDNAQLVVVTVSYLSEDSDVAALQLMNEWGIGSASENNGMLLLLVANEYRGWLATGAGLDSRFPDSMAEDYLNDYFWDYIDRDQFDEGVQSLTAELYDWYMDEYNAADSAAAPIQPAPEEYYYEEPHYESQRGGPSILSILIILLIIWSLITTSRYSRMRHWGYTGGFWPIFWFGGHRLYHSWHHQHRRGPRGPGAPGGPGPRPGPGPSHYSTPRSGGVQSRGSGFGGHSGGGAGRSGSSFGGGAGRSGGSFGGSRGGGGGGRGGGGGGGRR